LNNTITAVKALKWITILILLRVDDTIT